MYFVSEASLEHLNRYRQPKLYKEPSVEYVATLRVVELLSCTKLCAFLALMQDSCKQ